MNIYKFRAECVSDINKLTNLLIIANIKSHMKIITKEIEFPDCEVVMKTDCPLSAIKSVVEKLPDGHVILETIKLIDEHTGERDYALTSVTWLESVTVLNDKDIPNIGAKGDTEVVVRFSNRRSQAVSLRPLDTPEKIGKAFILLGQNILNDEQLHN